MAGWGSVHAAGGRGGRGSAHRWGAFGQIPQLGKAGVEACINVIGGLLTITATHTNIDAQTRRGRRQQHPIIVELGPGMSAANLITLATRFPDATVYGIEKEEEARYFLGLMLAGSPVRHRIHILADSSRTYAGSLRQRADIVVAVAPDPGAPVNAGIRTFAKPGSQVLVLTEQQKHHDSLQAEFGGKATIREVPVLSSRYQATEGEYVVSMTSLGVPLTSAFLWSNHGPWEIYIPSW